MHTQHKRDNQTAVSKNVAVKKWIEPRQPIATIKGLALGIFKGEIFTNKQIKEQDYHLLTSIFEPLEFMSDEDQHEWDKHPPSLIYAYSKDALNSRQINGYPVFDTICTLWKNDAEDVAAYHEQIRAAVDDAMQGFVHYGGRPAPPITSTRSSAAPKGKLQNVKDSRLFGCLGVDGSLLGLQRPHSLSQAGLSRDDPDRRDGRPD